MSQAALDELARVQKFDSRELVMFMRYGVRRYWAEVFTGRDDAHPLEWSGSFTLWCLHKAGIAIELAQSLIPPRYGFRWALRELGPAERPLPGDVAYRNRPCEHHAVVICALDETVVTVDADQGGAAPIMRKQRPLSHWTGFYSIDPLLPRGES